MNRQRDIRDGGFAQLISNALDTKLREDLERKMTEGIRQGIKSIVDSKYADLENLLRYNMISSNVIMDEITEATTANNNNNNDEGGEYMSEAPE